MIVLDPVLLDPHLEPAPSPKTHTRKRVAASGTNSVKRSAREKTSQDIRIPSARALARFLGAAQTAVRLRGQVTVLLTTDAAIRRLNNQFRGKNKATDVLSFPAEGLGAEGIAGDLAISVTTALSQAAEQGHSLATEIKVLVLHGLLHLAGYDHEVDEGQMARRELVLRARLKLPSGLIERAEKLAEPGMLLSHPSRKNENATRVGHPVIGGKSAKHPSGAKAPGSLKGPNVRAKARTLQSETHAPQAEARALQIKDGTLQTLKAQKNPKAKRI